MTTAAMITCDWRIGSKITGKRRRMLTGRILQQTTIKAKIK
jgi:hypothetical protein